MRQDTQETLLSADEGRTAVDRFGVAFKYSVLGFKKTRDEQAGNEFDVRADDISQKDIFDTMVQTVSDAYRSAEQYEKSLLMRREISNAVGRILDEVFGRVDRETLVIKAQLFRAISEFGSGDCRYLGRSAAQRDLFKLLLDDRRG